jgi:hypothetical protein
LSTTKKRGKQGKEKKIRNKCPTIELKILLGDQSRYMAKVGMLKYLNIAKFHGIIKSIPMEIL